MTKITLDDFDHVLLNALIEDSTRTSAQLAGIVNLSPSQCARRRVRLEQSGLIVGYGARINNQILGLGLRAITRVNLSKHNEAAAADFARFVKTAPEIESAWSVSGDADYILNILVHDLNSFAQFIHQRLLPRANVTQVKSEIVLLALK